MPKFKELLLNVATAGVTLAAVAMVGIRIKEYFVPPASPNAPQPPHKVSAWRDFAAAGQNIGPTTAAVTIVEFTDFQCPFCKKASAELQQIVRQYPGQVRVLVRHFPLPSHQFAVAAAVASECAGRQRAFAPYHDLLFASQDSIGKVSWNWFARVAGVGDSAAFARCLDDSAAMAVVKRDQEAANKLGVVGTPTFLINDLAVSGYRGEGALTNFVRDALGPARTAARPRATPGRPAS